MMAAKLDYRWHLRQVMAARGMFATTDLLEPLSERGVRLSSSQVYRLVVERPERLSLKVLMALLDVLDCSMDELIEPVAAAATASKAAGGAGRGEAGVGELGVQGPSDAKTTPELSIRSRRGVAAQAWVGCLGEVQRCVEAAGVGADVQLVHRDLVGVEPGQQRDHHLASEATAAPVGVGGDLLDIARSSAGVAHGREAVGDDAGGEGDQLARRASR